MEVRTLYRTTKNGKTTVGPNKPAGEEYTETFRVIAGEGMLLTDGTSTYVCVDTDKPEAFSEISDPDYDPDAEEYVE